MTFNARSTQCDILSLQCVVISDWLVTAQRSMLGVLSVTYCHCSRCYFGLASDTSALNARSTQRDILSLQPLLFRTG